MAQPTHDVRPLNDAPRAAGTAPPAWLLAALLCGLAGPLCYSWAADNRVVHAGVLGDDLLPMGVDWVAVSTALAFAVGSLVGLLLGRARRAPVAASTADPPALTQSGTNRAVEKRARVRNLFAGDIAALFSDRVEVRSLMSEAPETVPPTMSAEEVAATMSRHRVRHVLVSKVYGQVLGIISDRDVLSREGRTAAELMTADPVCISVSALVSEAIDLMLERNISCLPVVRGNFLCGIITTADVLVGMRCALDALERAARDLQCDASPALQATV